MCPKGKMQPNPLRLSGREAVSFSLWLCGEILTLAQEGLDGEGNP